MLKMAEETDDLDVIIEKIKTKVKKSFAHVYATLKARELKTLRQLDAIRKQCQDDNDLKRNCVRNINVSYENEATLVENISKYGVIDFAKLNFDSKIFTLEDYITPNDDHMYCYKTIEDIDDEEQIKDLEAIEEAAFKQMITNEDCVCYVSVPSKDIPRKFRDIVTKTDREPCLDNPIMYNGVQEQEVDEENVDEDSCISDLDVIKINPTDEWMNSIKSQTEIEPTQLSDVMEHSTIACS